MSKLLLNKSFSEHSIENISSFENLALSSVLFKGKEDKKCIEIVQSETIKHLHCNYYIGVDWLLKNELAVYVSPKLNDQIQQTDYLKMLYSCLKHPDVADFTRDLYEIKFDQPQIEITQKQDLLTPLLIIQFLQIIKSIVKKGLKKSYYRVEENLTSKIKGKVLVSQTLKQNIIKNKRIKTFCEYEEFGFNCIENRILKHTLTFVQKYLCLFPEYSKFTTPIVNFCYPAFQDVNEDISVNSIKKISHNSFYSEYKEAIRIAHLILKRFGYNLTEVETQKTKKVKVSPFWIDMPKLFELYILGLLKDKYFNQVQFQIKGTYGQPDFILVNENEKIIIDTKYKRRYQYEKYEADDIRQLSGYSRDTQVLSRLGFSKPEQLSNVVDCLIIYPDQEASENLPENLKENPVKGFAKFYKIPIKLPTLNH